MDPMTVGTEKTKNTYIHTHVSSAHSSSIACKSSWRRIRDRGEFVGGGREFVTEESSWARRRRIHAQPRRAGGYDGASSSAEGESSWTWMEEVDDNMNARACTHTHTHTHTHMSFCASRQTRPPPSSVTPTPSIHRSALVILTIGTEV